METTEASTSWWLGYSSGHVQCMCSEDEEADRGNFLLCDSSVLGLQQDLIYYFLVLCIFPSCLLTKLKTWPKRIRYLSFNELTFSLSSKLENYNNKTCTWNSSTLDG